MNKNFFFETVAVSEDKKRVKVFVVDESNKAKLVLTKFFDRDQDIDYEELKERALKEA